MSENGENTPHANWCREWPSRSHEPAFTDNCKRDAGLGPKLELNTNYEPIPARFRTYQLGESLMNDFTDWSEQKTLAETHYESLSTMIHELLKLSTSQDHGNRSQAYSCCPVYSPLYPKTVPYLSHTYLEPRASLAK